MTQYDKNWPWLKYVIAPEKTGAHFGAGVCGSAVQELADGGNGEVRARDLFFQRWSGEAIWRRGTNSGAIAESCDVRFEAGDVRRGNHDTVVKAIEKGELTPSS